MLVEARGEIFTIPEEKGDVRNITNSSGSAERQPAWSPDGKWISYFSDKSGEYKLVIESQDGIGAPREIAFQKAGVLLHAGVVARFEEAALHRHQPQRVGDGRRDRARRRSSATIRGWCRSARWRRRGVPTRSGSRSRRASTRCIAPSSSPNVETGEKKQVTDGLADAMYPVWDASGKYLWFLASTDFGLASQWLDMTSYGREETFALYLAVLNKTDAEPAAAGERRRPRRRRRAPSREHRTSRAAAPAGRDRSTSIGCSSASCRCRRAVARSTRS